MQVSTRFDGYQLLLRVIDEADIRNVFGQHPEIEKRVRKSHQKYFRAWLRKYEREVWMLNRTRIQSFAADGKWPESWRAIGRAAEYGRLCLRLEWAACAWAVGMSNPLQLVESCVSELRKLDAYAGFLRASMTPFPSA